MNPTMKPAEYQDLIHGQDYKQPPSSSPASFRSSSTSTAGAGQKLLVVGIATVANLNGATIPAFAEYPQQPVERQLNQEIERNDPMFFEQRSLLASSDLTLFTTSNKDDEVLIARRVKTANVEGLVKYENPLPFPTIGDD